MTSKKRAASFGRDASTNFDGLDDLKRRLRLQHKATKKVLGQQIASISEKIDNGDYQTSPTIEYILEELRISWLTECAWERTYS